MFSVRNMAVCTVAGNVNCLSHSENRIEVPQKIKYRTIT